MTRFGDFSLVDELAESEVADCFEAMHDVQGGPFFLKRYRRVDPAYVPALAYRCEVLMAVQHDNLAPHLGHGDVDGVLFAVSPFLEGLDLERFIESVKQRRVVLKLEALLYIVREVAKAVAALHAVAHDGARPLLGHGDVCTRHVRIGPNGEVWLTGLTTPRGLSPERPPEPIWDSAGLGALLYDLIPLTRAAGQRPPLPGPLDRVVRRTLGIGPPEQQLTPAAFAARLDEVAELLKLPALEARLLAEAAARALHHDRHRRSMSAADALPTLEPVIAAEPSAERAALELEPISPPVRSDVRPTPAPPKAAPPKAADAAPAPSTERSGRVEKPASVRPPPSARATTNASGADAAASPGPAAKPTARASLSDDLPHRAQTPLSELGGLHDVALAPSASAPWVAPPDEQTNESPIPALGSLDVGNEVDAPVGDDEVPLDPFVEQTLPGHAVVPFSTTEPPSSGSQDALDVETGFEDDRTSPGVPAVAHGIPGTVSDPPSSPLTTQPEADAALPKTLEVPREISAIVKLDAPLQAQLGLLADATESSSSGGDDEGAFEVDPAVAALLARGVASSAAIQKAREAQKSRGGSVIEILVASGEATDAAVADALAAEAIRPRLSDASLAAHLPSPELCRRVPQTLALGRRMLPLSLEGPKLTLAVTDPFDEAGAREVARLVGATDVRVHVAAKGPLTDATLKAYRALGARLATGEGQPSVLLCMKDEEEVARFGARFADEGFHVEHAGDVPTAKMLLDARPPTALVLALDVEDAQELLGFARAHEDHADTPLFVTGDAGDDAYMAHLLDLGADDFFERPASLHLVLAKLRRALNKRGVPLAASAPPPPLVKQSASPPPPSPPPASLPPPSAPRAAEVSPPPPPTFDFWENSAPLEDSSMPPPGDVADSGPMFAEPTGVMGTLRQMAVSEIVQSLEMGRKTARVELVPTEGQRGMVGFEDGQVVYAECGELLGEKAFYALAQHTEGFFRIRYGEGPSERNVDGSTTFLLLEAMRLMDEAGGGESPPAKDADEADKTPTPFD